MRYSAMIFDCDGVLLDSNQLKADAMAEVVQDYGPVLQERFVAHHRKHGGISRYQKFDYFLRTMVGEYSDTEYERLLSTLARLVEEKLLDVPLTDGALECIKAWSQYSNLYIVSGSDQQELRGIFDKRGLSRYFTAIYGSPAGKHVHCANILDQLKPGSRLIFFGDAVQDYRAARDNGMDFVFISGYTDFDDWKAWCDEEQIANYPDLLTAQQHLTL